MVIKLRLSQKLTIWNGDITRPGLGLTSTQTNLITERVSIIVHGASSINLQKPLVYMAEQVVYPSLAIGNLALSCRNLTRFIYVSTAYSSTFLEAGLEKKIEGHDGKFEENIRNIRSSVQMSATDELADLKAHGLTAQYETVRHPFPYSYAKHLTERLLLEMFTEAQKDAALTIFRPSCIGPAETRPYPFYEIPGSCPVSTAFASLIASPPRVQRFSSHLADPSSCATINEVPVDIVVNRLIAHTAFATTGCIHAAGGENGQIRTEDLSNAAKKFRKLWWRTPRYVWVDEYWKSENLCPLAKLFVIPGCSFTFVETKTNMIWEKMNEAERWRWPLYQHSKLSIVDSMIGREKSLQILLGTMIKRAYGLPASWTWMFMKMQSGGRKDMHDAADAMKKARMTWKVKSPGRKSKGKTRF